MSQTFRRVSAVSALALATVTAISGCTSEAASDSTPPISDPSELSIAFFIAGTGNAYQQAAVDGATETATEIGANLQIFDGQFNAQTQFNQIQTALTSGKFNAFIVEPNDGNQLCKIVTDSAAEKGVLVVTATGSLCGRDTNTGEDVWQPGTVAYVGGQTADVYEEWVKRIVSDHPNGAKVAVLTGPQVNANTSNVTNALPTLASAPGFSVVAQQATDYSTAQAYAATQTILRANPDVNIIMSNFSGMTQGVAQAIEEAGRSDVEVYDVGGDSWALDAVKRGTLNSSVVLLPKDELVQSVYALRDTVEGKDVPHVIDMSKAAALPGTNIADTSNVSKFTAEY